MTVTKQTYTATNIWTPSQLADLFRSAFIDAGLMTNWYDTFLSGSVENRILEVIYDGTKTYGKTYYWLQFTTTQISFAHCTAWNAVTHVPTGTLSLDFPTATTNNAALLVTLRSSLSTSIPITLIRYTSGVDPTHTQFMVGQVNTFTNFLISPPSHVPYSFIDLNKVVNNSFLLPRTVTNANSGISSNSFGAVIFRSWSFIRRSAIIGAAYKGSTFVNTHRMTVSSYGAMGRDSNTPLTNAGGNGIPVLSDGGTNTDYPTTCFILPVGDSTSNPAYASDYNPVCYGMPYSMYVPNSALPSDIGMVAHYANNTMQQLDTFVVQAGVEEWEIISVGNSPATGGTKASIALVARVI